MPIQFENTFVNPNIQVKGAEIPLEQLEKTSNILRDKYDKSYENLTKFQVLAKQAEQMADPLEREKVKQYIATYQPAIDQMVKDDALHRVGWQTMAMANEAAGNLKTFQDRAAEIKTIKDKLATLDINDTVNREYYQDMLDQATKQTAFDPNTKSFDFKPINVPNFVKDYDYAKFLFDASGNWKPDITASSNKNVIVKQAQYDAAGNLVTPGGIYDKATGYKVSKVEEEEVRKNILKALKGSPGAMEALDRDVNAKMWKMGLDANDPKNAATKSQIRDEVYNTKVLGVAQAAAQKESYRQVLENSNEETLNNTASDKWGFGAKQDASVVTPTSVREESYKPAENKSISEFLTNLKNTGFSTNQGSFSTADDARIKKFQEDPKNKNLMKLLINSLADKKYLTELQQTDPALYEKLTSSKIKTYNNGAKSFTTSTNIYDIQNALSENKPLTSLQMALLQEFAQNENVQLTSAYNVRNTNDKVFRKEMYDTYGDAVLTNGEYDPIKASKEYNNALFATDDGLTISKDASGNLKGLNTSSAKGLMVLDKLTGEIIPFTDYLNKRKEELPNDTKITISGKVEPGTLKHATSDNAYSGNEGRIAKAFGNAYTMDVNGEDIIVANPRDWYTVNATISELSKFTEGIHPKEKVPIYLGKEQPAGYIEIQSAGDKVVVNGMGVKKVMSTDEYKQWIRTNFTNQDNG